jgi:hypothetical protein
VTFSAVTDRRYKAAFTTKAALFVEVRRQIAAKYDVMD